jgi:hypothetical protein
MQDPRKIRSRFHRKIRSRSTPDPPRPFKDPPKIQSRSMQDPRKIHPGPTQDPLKTYSRSTQDPFKIHSRSTQDQFKIHSRSIQDPLQFHSISTPDPLQIPSSPPSKLLILIGKWGAARCFFARVTPSLDAVIVDRSSQTGLGIAWVKAQASPQFIDASRRSCFVDILVTVSNGVEAESG